jgi:flagellar motor switch protein FliM
MTLVPPDRAVTEVSLTRAFPDAPSHSALDQTGERLSRGLGDFLSGLLAAPATVTASAVYPREAPNGQSAVLRHVRLDPLRGAVALVMDPAELMRLVDRHYGGEGAVAGPCDRISPAADRFFTRIATGLCSLLPDAWKRFAVVTAEIVDECDETGGTLAVHAFAVTVAGGHSFRIECHYPDTMLEAIQRMHSLDRDSGDGEADREWQERLMNCALQVPFAVRAVFAEPELPLARLMSLRPGDIIPLCLPAQIDISVAGLPFARGSAGESNGRSAICIEHL